MDTKEIIKFGVLFVLYVFVPPVLGLILRGRKSLQRIAFFAMCFMTISGFFSAAEWGLTLGDVPDYRGHARGFHFYFNEIFALSLIVATAFEKKAKFKLFPPGLWLYLLYWILSCLSIINAPSALYVSMTAFKVFKASVIFVAAYNFIRTENELQFFFKTMALTLFWEALIVVKMKYIDGHHQIMGTFEHQNALAMYVNLISMLFLAVGASLKGRWANIYLLVFLMCGVVVEFTLSRAGLVIFGMGTVAVMVLILVEKFTARRVAVISFICVCAVIGLLKTLGTIIERFNDPYTYDSKQTRIMLRAASLQMFRDYPIGIGWNNYGVVINHPYHYGDQIDQYFRLHGDRVDPNAPKGIEEGLYYLLLAETGFQGFLSFVAIMGLFLWWNFRAAWEFRGQFLGAVSIGIAMGCSINYLQSLVERVLTQPRNMMLWLILLAITAKIETWRRQSVRKRKALANERKSAIPELAMSSVGRKF